MNVKSLKILHLENCPDKLRGKITKYMNRIEPYLFVGCLTNKIADVIWRDVCETEEVKSWMIYVNKNHPQGYEIKTYNNPKYNFEDFCGLKILGNKIHIEEDLYKYLMAKTGLNYTLLEHSVKVGILVRELLLNGFCHTVFKVIAKKMNVDFIDLVNLSVFICVLHDIGKIHPDFQICLSEVNLNKFKIESYYNFLNENNLLNKVKGKVRHEIYGAKLLRNKYFLKEPVFTDSLGLLNEIGESASLLISSHHQVRLSEENHEIENKIWEAVQERFYLKIKEIFKLPNINISESPYGDIYYSLLLGVLNISDYLASSSLVYKTDKKLNNDATKEEIEDYIKHCSYEIRKFILDNGLSNNLNFKSCKTFKESFPYIKNEKKLQKIVEKLGYENIQTIIIESPCGSGKTEAGFYAISKMVENSNSNGIYVVMPTHMNSSAMLGRAKGFLFHHGAEFKAELFSGNSIFVENENEYDQTEMSDWMNNKKFKLLYAFAIMTLDQMLYSVRYKKYNFMQMISSLSRGIIFDEVHAYDGYTLDILKEFLIYCGIVETPIVIMSATLPLSTKRELIDNARALDWNCEREDYVLDEYKPSMGYPMVTVLLKNGEIVEYEIEFDGEEQKKYFEFKPYFNSPEKIAKDLIEKVRHGGCLGFIGNSVKEAQEIYKYVKLYNLDKDMDIVLYHGDYLPSKKEEIGDKLSLLLGKKGKEEGLRPKKMIVIGTQILEQSIDIDFDYISIQLSVIDSTLQRLGRHLRHDDKFTIRENRQKEIEDWDIVTIYIPDEIEDQYLDLKNKYGVSGSKIYGEKVLDSTYNALLNLNKNYIDIPKDIRRLMEEVYGKVDALPLSFSENKRKKALLGSVSISPTSMFQLDNNKYHQLNESEKSIRDESGNKKIQICLLSAEEYENCLNNKVEWDEDFCKKMLKERVLTIRKYLIDNYKMKNKIEMMPKGKNLLKHITLWEYERVYEGSEYESLKLKNLNCYYNNEYGILYQNEDEEEYLIERLR